MTDKICLYYQRYYSYMPNHALEILLLMEEHREAYDSPVDQQASNYRHSHSRNRNHAAVSQQHRKGCRHVTHQHQDLVQMYSHSLALDLLSLPP